MILLGMGAITAITVLYLGRKGWYAFHKAVGITPGVLTYQDPHAPLSLPHIKWQKLSLKTAHLSVLTHEQVRQLQRIDEKVGIYQNYQQALEEQNITAALTEAQFVLHKMLSQRLPEMLASHYQLTQSKPNVSVHRVSAEARQLLQDALDNIENRLDNLLAQMQQRHLQDLRVLRRYMDSHEN